MGTHDEQSFLTGPNLVFSTSGTRDSPSLFPASDGPTSTRLAHSECRRSGAFPRVRHLLLTAHCASGSLPQLRRTSGDGSQLLTS